MNDRQCVEAILFPLWFLNIIECGVKNRDDDFKRCQQYLLDAIEDALKGHEPRRQAALVRRAARAHNAVTEDYRRGGVHVDKIGLIAVYTLQEILDVDYLVLTEGSKLSAAIHAIIEALGEAFAEARLDASAKKHAGKALLRLQSEGYFQDIRREAA